MMNIVDAIIKAQKEDKEIALPTNDHCQNGGYQFRAKPFPYHFQVMEFYGDDVEYDNFALRPVDIIRDDWFVID